MNRSLVCISRSGEQPWGKLCFWRKERVLEKTGVPLLSPISVWWSQIAHCVAILVYCILKDLVTVCCKERGKCVFGSLRNEKGKAWHWNFSGVTHDSQEVTESVLLSQPHELERNQSVVRSTGR